MAVAHRGASAYAPENTVAAFDEAVRLGAQAVEFDVRLTADGQPVVIHDATLDRTTSGRGFVQDWTLLDLLRLDAGGWMHLRFQATRIPTLQEALLAIGPNATPVLELKVKVPGELLLSHLQRMDLVRDCVVMSFEPAWLIEMRKASREVPLGLLAERWKPDLPEAARDLDAELMVVHTDILTPAAVGACEARGLEVWCFTANDVGMVAACAALGVTGIITDRPDLIRVR
jgi:glycerophosphoryl diester phosphodiesterase